VNPEEAPGAISPEQSSSSTGLPSRPNRKPPYPELRTDELDVPESSGDATLRSSTISDPGPGGGNLLLPLKLQLTSQSVFHHLLLHHY